jgi:hypothetical protein
MYIVQQQVGEQTTTGGTIEETVEHTAGTTEDWSNNPTNDGRDEVHSTPQPPAPGMRFDSYDSAREHYRAYSQRKGFEIRIDWSRKDAKDDTNKAYLVCTKAGKPHAEKEDTQNPKSCVKKRKKNTHPRTGCTAHIYIKRRDSWWYVVHSSDDHNHPMLIKPSLSRFLRAHRNIPSEEKTFLRILHASNIETCRQMQLMASFYGKLNDVPYIEKDLANLRASFRNENNHHDMQDTLAFFDKMRAEDKDFFYKIKLDAEDRVENLFWVDGASRRAYKSGYNDCISFDTTYLTNRYKLPCAPFIGINNHGQSVQFGCGFVRQELKDNFVWLFKMFTLAMGGIEPKNIITDQDSAMRGAIRDVFPHATHRNCRWHVIQNATERMGSFMAKHPALLEAFNACVNNSLTPEEFEDAWLKMIDEHNVRDNVDLYSLWEQRKVWVPAYFMHAFYPFLQTTARSEGFNAVLKRYIKPSNSLFEFVQQYMAVQDKILNAELKAETDTALTDPDWWCGSPMERQMAKAYTRKIFLRFQKEMQKSMSYQCDHLNGYQFELSTIGLPVPHYGYRSYRVFANWEEGVYTCNCCKFDRDGMLCCHIIKVMTHIKVHQIPEPYILKRWTLDAEAILGETNGKDTPNKKEMPEESRNMMVFASFREEFVKAAKVGVKTADGRKIIKKHLKEMKQELAVVARREEKKAREAEEDAITMPSSSAPIYSDLPPATTVPPNMQHSNSSQRAIQETTLSGSRMSSNQHIQNPPVSNTRGRPQQIANKNPLDLATKKSRKCSHCGSTDHTIRRCPEKLKLMGYKP